MKVTARPTPAFIKALKKLPPDRAEAAANSLDLFQQEPALPRFRFRALENNPGYYIITARRGDRIILRKVEDEADVYEAVDVGPHDNVYRRWNRR